MFAIIEKNHSSVRKPQQHKRLEKRHERKTVRVSINNPKYTYRFVRSECKLKGEVSFEKKAMYYVT